MMRWRRQIRPPAATLSHVRTEEEKEDQKEEKEDQKDEKEEQKEGKEEEPKEEKEKPGQVQKEEEGR